MTTYLVMQSGWEGDTVILVAASKVVANAYIQTRPDWQLNLYITEHDTLTTTSEAIAQAERDNADPG